MTSFCRKFLLDGRRDLAIGLRARVFYEVIVDEGGARINYHLIEIESE